MKIAKPKEILRKISFSFGLILGFFGFATKAFAIFDAFLTPIRIGFEIIIWSAIIFGASFAFVYTSNAILGWVTTPGFIQLKVTENPLVQEGWQVTRDFVNLFFILLVVWIGISIALRVGENSAKKALPRLVAAALLINFTPVICGVIIDASNIFMNFFLSAGIAGNNRLLNIANLSGGILLNSFTALKGNWLNGSAWAAAFFQLLFVVFFNFIAGVILIMIAILLLVRHVALWVLVILAPLAFFAWIIPNGGFQRIWQTWWRQFIQWSIVGVTASFFLFLSQVMMSHIHDIVTQNVQGIMGPGNHVFLSAQSTEMLIYSIPLILLLIGFFASVQSAPMGASAIVNFTRRQARKLPSRLTKAGGWGWRKAGEKFESLGPVQRARERQTEKAITRLEQKAQMKPFSELSFREKTARFVTFGPRWAREKLDIRKIQQSEKKIPTIQKMVDDFKKFETKEARLAQALKTGAKPLEKVAAVLAMFEKGEIRDVPEKLKKDVFDQLPKLPQKFRKSLIKAMPDLAEQKRKELEAQIATAETNADVKKMVELYKQEKRLGLALSKEDVDKGYRTIIDKVIGNASPKDIENFDEKMFKSPDVQAAIHKFWTGREISKAVEKFGRSFLEIFQKGLNQTGLDWYKQNNPRLYRYLLSNAAKNLGLEAPPSQEDFKEKNIPLPDNFHGGKEWNVLTEAEKEKMKEEIDMRKNPDQARIILAKYANLEGLSEEEIRRLIELHGPKGAEEIIRQRLAEGGLEHLNQRFSRPSLEETGEGGIENPESKLGNRENRRPPEEES